MSRLEAQPLRPLEVPLVGRRLIEASAGTGKTWTIAMLFLRLVVERGLPVDRILVVTFTRAATAELSRRLRERLQEALAVLDRLDTWGIQRTARELGLADDPLLAWIQQLPDPLEARRRIAEALHGMDGAAISTIHGFCARMLQEFAFESGSRLDVDLLDDERAMIRRAVEDAWASGAREIEPLLLQQLIARRLGPAGLLDFAATALANPSVPLLPAVEALPDEAPAKAAVARWLAARQHARGAWFTGGREAADGLKRAAGRELDGRVYSFGRVASWHYQIDQWFEADEVTSKQLPEGLAHMGARSLAQRTRKGHAPPSHPFFQAAQELCDADGEVGPVIESWVARFQRVFLEDVRQRVAEAKERSRSVSYSDLLHRLDAALQDGVHGDALASGIAGRFPAMLIDEFQDTDPVQFRIFSRVHEGAEEGSTTLFLIGDPKQAIYGFRGADVLAYLQARNQTDARYTMTTNYRSDPGLLRAVASLFEGHPAPFVDPRIQFVSEVEAHASSNRLVRLDDQGRRHDVPAMHLVFVPREVRDVRRPHHTGEMKGWWVHTEYGERVADEVVSMLSNGLHLVDKDRLQPLGPGDVAVLVRSNRQARKLHAALSKRGVPAALQGDASVLDTLEAEEMEALVRALADPGDPAAIRAALATRVLGHDATELRRLYVHEPAWDAWVERFQRWGGAWAGSGFLGAFRRMVHECDVPARLLALAGGERSMTNLLHLSELLQRVATDHRLHRAGLVAWLAWARSDPKAARSELGQEADPIRLESDSGAVKLVTVHRAKGLEYPVVLLPYLGEGLRDPDGLVRFHDDDGQLTLDMGSADHQAHAARAAQEELAESTRLLYVALTRAKQHVALFWGAFPRHGSSALAWLLHGADAEAPSIAELAGRVRNLTDPQRFDRLKRVVDRSSGSVYLRHLYEGRPLRFEPEVGEVPTLRPRMAERQLAVAWRVGSFSSLVRGGGAAGTTPVGEGRDVDALDGVVAAPVPVRASGPPVPLAEWPRGAAPGTVLHGVLEVLDFQADRPTRLATVAEALRTHGGPEAWAERLTDGLHLAAQVPFGPQEPGLADLPMADRLDELGFLLPAKGPSPAALAGAFDRHATHPLARSYALRLATMGFPPLHGLLKGYVDMVYRHGEGFGILDYKSNHLGEVAEAYGEAALADAMLHHDYVLQYHLYVLALHRFLRARRPGYDYDRHVLGARYLFLRGMVPQRGPGAGVFADRPPRALIEALDQLFGEAA